MCKCLCIWFTNSMTVASATRDHVCCLVIVRLCSCPWQVKALPHVALSAQSSSEAWLLKIPHDICVPSRKKGWFAGTDLRLWLVETSISWDVCHFLITRFHTLFMPWNIIIFSLKWFYNIQPILLSTSNGC